MNESGMLTVGELAELSKVSVRTLHHYDEIGLLPPTARSESGYRLYDEHAVARLQQILVMRELGLTLERIRMSLDEAGFDTVGALEAQLKELTETIARLDTVRSSVAAMLHHLRSEDTMKSEDIAEIFDGFDPGAYEAEVEERWGDTDAYRESQRRTGSYGQEDWEQIKAEGEEIEAGFAAAMASGVPPKEAVAIAERHRTHIDRWFYPCTPGMHANLAEMYTADPRFAEHYNRRAAGLAEYVAAAVKANAAAQ